VTEIEKRAGKATAYSRKEAIIWRDFARDALKGSS
jgi:hypothetical protein